MGDPPVVGASLRRLLFSFVALFCFALASFALFLHWAASTEAASRQRILPLWAFPDKGVQREWMETKMAAVTSIKLGEGETVHVSTHFNEKASTEHPTFPDLFYDGVMYGVSAWNPEGKPTSPVRVEADTKALLDDILDMWPKPSHVFHRASRRVEDGWHEEGFAVLFDVPSLEAERGMQFLGRLYGQASIYKWWGHVWGLHPVDHVTIMQGVLPVASALNHMRHEIPAKLVDSPDGWEAGAGLPVTPVPPDGEL